MIGFEPKTSGYLKIFFLLAVMPQMKQKLTTWSALKKAAYEGYCHLLGHIEQLFGSQLNLTFKKTKISERNKHSNF